MANCKWQMASFGTALAIIKLHKIKDKIELVRNVALPIPQKRIYNKNRSATANFSCQTPDASHQRLRKIRDKTS